MSSEAPSQASEPLKPLPVQAPSVQQQTVTCPKCLADIPLGARYCTQCGNPMPPAWLSVPPLPPPKKPMTLLVVGVILVALLVAGVAGYFVYRNTQQGGLQTAENSERAAALLAISQLQLTCLSIRTDNSHLFYSGYTYSGYGEISEVFGVSNPTKFIFDVTWNFTIRYTSIGLVVPGSSSFHIGANGNTRATVPFRVTAAQYNSLPTNPDFSRFTVTLSETYAITGSYNTYNHTKSSTFDSSTNSGTGSLGSSGNLPQC